MGLLSSPGAGSDSGQQTMVFPCGHTASPAPAVDKYECPRRALPHQLRSVVVVASCVVALSSSQRCLPALHTPVSPHLTSPSCLPSFASCLQEVSTGLFLTVTGEEVVLRERELRNVCRFDAWQRQARVRLTLTLVKPVANAQQYTSTYLQGVVLPRCCYCCCCCCCCCC